MFSSFNCMLDKLSALIQAHPLRLFGAGLLAGLLIAVFFRLFIALLFIVLCLLATVYLISPDSAEK